MTTAQQTDTLLDTLRRNLSVLGELAVRYGVESQPERAADLPTISGPEDVKRLVQPEMAHLAQEQLRVLLLNTRNDVVGQRVIYQGDIQSISVRAAEVFRPAILEVAPCIIVCHNHPSSSAEPSPEDVAVTKKLAEAGELLGIKLLDHVVIGSRGIVSLKERGLISGS